MSDQFGDPPVPPEPGEGQFKAAELVGHLTVFKSAGEGEWPARDEEKDEAGKVTQRASGPRPYVICDVWQLDRAGIVRSAGDVRVSWWRVVEQLRGASQPYVVGKPVKQEDNSVILVVPSDADRKIIELVKAEILDSVALTSEHSSEPF